MIESVVGWIVSTVGKWGYAGIVVMMALESSFVPFPSEVVMIPAGYLAHKGELNIYLAIFWGIFGSWMGALVNYYMAVYLGRPFLLRWGRYFFLSEKSFHRVEAFFVKHGEIGTFTGRLVPVIRQYISFPAGLARMNLARFLFFTGLGAGIWVSVLAWIGWALGGVQQALEGRDVWNSPLAKELTGKATALTLLFCVLVVAVYVFVRRRRRASGNPEHSDNAGTRP